MVSLGEGKEGIARALGIKTETLVKHYADNLDNGAVRRLKEVGSLLYKAARKGNVTAQKFLATQAAMIAAGIVATGVTAPVPRLKPLGKKEEAEQAAITAGEDTGWGDLLQTPIAGAGARIDHAPTPETGPGASPRQGALAKAP